MNTLYLYGTEDCHLCDEVADQLLSKNIPFTFIDIVTDDALMEAFGWFIPVIKYNEIIWKSPLDLEAIIQDINII